MLTLLSPAALGALSVLALPAALHLWRHPPRTVQLGSLRFLQAHTGRRLHDLRWRERLLLLARLVLLVLLVCLLARPRWQQPPARGPQRWLLLDPTAAPTGPSLVRLRALQAAGYTTRVLVPGLPLTSEPPTDSNAPAPDLWSLLREADAMLPAGSALAIFTPARLAALRGVRPALRSKVEWIETPDLAGNTPHVWIESVQPAPAPTGTPLAMIGSSDASVLRFADSPPAGWKQAARADTIRLLAPGDEATPWVTVHRSSPLKVLVLHDPDRTEDARCLAAAIRSAVETSRIPLDLHLASIKPNLVHPPAIDWTFWLSADPPPDSIETGRSQLFRDTPHATDSTHGWMIPQPDTPGAAVLTPSVQLWRRGPAPSGTVFWTDGYGVPLLTRTSTGHGPRWQFASRFHPDWSDLPHTTAFPGWIRSLLLPDAIPGSEHDFRLAAASQAQPSEAAAPPSLSTLSPVDVDSRDLHWPFWTLAALLFILERVLSHRRHASNPAPVASRNQSKPAVAQ